MPRPFLARGSDLPILAERVVIKRSPLNAEAAPLALAEPITATGAHYVRTNFGVPDLDAERHVVAIGGAVGHPLRLGVADLRSLPQRDVTVTLECAGNGRLGMTPLPPGEPWGPGAVSTACWTGVPLAIVLERAGVRDDVVEILCAGADRGVPEGADAAVGFERSLPLEVARDPDVLLALEMNGEPLPPEHGAPVRLVVPGWYGMASVKWLARIAALTRPFAGWFQSERYVYATADDPRPVDVVRVKSMIVAPGPGARLPRGRVAVWGWAWSGAAPVVAVELSLDGGAAVAARLGDPVARHAWRRFSATFDVLAPGRHTVRARARDAAGRVQPDAPEPNLHGYGMNAVTTTVFSVE